jgi:hypothetical protein
MKHGQPSSLGVLLAISPSRPAFPALLSYLRKRIEQDAPTYLYALDEGGAAIVSPELIQLSRDGLRLFCCSQAAARWNVAHHQEITRAGLGLLDDLMVATDRFLVLTPSTPDPAKIDQDFPVDSVPLPARSSREVLVILERPPDSDSHAAEGLRVASGLAAGRRLRVTLAVRGWAPPRNLQDLGWILDPVLAGHLDVLVASDAGILAVAGEHEIRGKLSSGKVPIVVVTEDELARLAGTAFAVLRF